MYSPKIQKAILLALKLHAGQTRKASKDTPYITHPIALALELAHYTNDEDIVCAGLLHDVVEDTNYTLEAIEAEFGDVVKSLVAQMTEDKSIKDYGERKQNAIEKASQNELSLFVKSADNLVNIKDLLQSIQEQGESVWDNFNGSKQQKFNYFQEILNRSHRYLPTALVMDYVSALKDLEYTSGGNIGFEAR